MPRETKAQRTSRITMLLAEYDARSLELRKLTKEVDNLKLQVKELDPGEYGDWILATGTPREITDQAAVKADYAARGVPMPTKMTDPPVIVRHK